MSYNLENFYIRRNKNVQIRVLYFNYRDNKPVSAYFTFRNGHTDNLKIDRFNEEFTSIKTVVEQVKPNSEWIRLVDGMQVWVLKVDIRKGAVLYRRNEKPYSDYYQAPMGNFMDCFKPKLREATNETKI